MAKASNRRKHRFHRLFFLSRQLTSRCSSVAIAPRQSWLGTTLALLTGWVHPWVGYVVWSQFRWCFKLIIIFSNTQLDTAELIFDTYRNQRFEGNKIFHDFCLCFSVCLIFFTLQSVGEYSAILTQRFHRRKRFRSQIRLPSNYLRLEGDELADWKGWHMVSGSITSTIVPASRNEHSSRGAGDFCPSYIWSVLPFCAAMRGTGRIKGAQPEMVLGTLPLLPRLGSRHTSG